MIKVNNISRPRQLFFPVFIPCFLRTDNLILHPASKSATRLTPLRFSKEAPMGKMPNERGREFRRSGYMNVAHQTPKSYQEFRLIERILRVDLVPVKLPAGGGATRLLTVTV